MSVRLPLALLLLVFASTAFAQDNSRYFNKREVNIPFFADDREQIQEVQLYASLNGGNWVLVGRAHPNQKRFHFTTDRDGTYDFGVRTVYVNGRSKPERTEDLRPSRRTVIDTIAPQITLRPYAGADKIAGVEWEATDENIDPKSIRLEYRWPGTREWRSIDKDKEFRPKDQQSWNLAGRGNAMEVRVRARDLAGNEAVSDPVTTPPSAGGNFDRGMSDTRGIDRLPDTNKVTDLPPLRPFDTGGLRETNIGSSTSARSSNLIYVNNKEITLEHDFKVGASGYKKAELYVRKPAQTSWILVKNASFADVSGQSSEGKTEGTLTCLFSAETEGIYGFFIRIQNNVEKWSDDEPNRLSQPNVEVMVDMTPPKVTLNPPKIRPAGDGQAIMDLSWLAEDSLSGLQPESLKVEYSETGIGQEWSPIVEQQSGSGNYSWNVPPKIWKVFLRVTARDRSGNIGVYKKEQPVLVDLQKPSVEKVKGYSGGSGGGTRVGTPSPKKLNDIDP